MANVIIVLILVAAVGYGIYSFIHHLRHALNTLPDTLAEVNLSARNVTVWTKADADEEVIRKAIRDAGYLPLRTKEKV